MASTKKALKTQNPDAIDLDDVILLEVAVPQDLALKLQSMAGDQPLADHMVQLCGRFADCNPADLRGLFLRGVTRDAVEKILGRGMQSEQDLLDLLAKSKSLQLMGGLRVTVPDDVLELITARYYGDHKDLNLAAEVQKLVEKAFQRFRDGGL